MNTAASTPRDDDEWANKKGLLISAGGLGPAATPVTTRLPPSRHFSSRLDEKLPRLLSRYFTSDMSVVGVLGMDCCADCGGGVSLKACKSCWLVKYCNADCQRNHWPTHKKLCKQRAAELHDEALFKDPPAKEDCPICFLPLPAGLLSCMTLPPATISSVPIREFAVANEELANKATEEYFSCCGKSICGGCMHSFRKSGNIGTCAFCKGVNDKTDEESVEELMKRVEVNDADAMYVLGSYYNHGQLGLQQDRGKALELWKHAAALGSSKSHFHLGNMYREGGDMKKAKFHYEAAAMAGHEVARYNLGCMEYLSGGNVERAVKHWTIAASAGDYYAMHSLIKVIEVGRVSRDEINSTLTAYNTSCDEMRSEARDNVIQLEIKT